MKVVPFLTALVTVSNATAVESLDVERAVALALERNAEVATRASDARAARARLAGAALPLQANPELSVAAGPRTRAGERTVDVNVELSQRVEVFGQRGARIEVAQAEVRARDAALAAKRTEVAAQVRVAFARVLAAERLAGIAQDALVLSRDALRAAEKRFELGDGSRLEVNAARVEVGRSARETVLARQALEAARAELRLAVALPAAETIMVMGELPKPGPPLASREGLVERALATRSDLAALRSELEGAKAEARFASRERLPVPRLGASYSREEGANIVLAAVGFDLPLWNRNEAARGVAEARVTRAERELEAGERRVQQEVLLAVERLEAAREAVRVYDADLVAATRENLALTTQAYQSGKLGLPEVLLIRRSALDARRGEVEALLGMAEAEAELRRALGNTGEAR